MNEGAARYRIISTLCGGFLIAVLWFDLMHDVAVHPHLTGVPDAEGLSRALITVQTYYQRVTVDAYPMNRLVGLFMLVGIVTSLIRLFRSSEPIWLRVACPLLFLPPTLGAMFSIVPAAVALASATDQGQQLLLATHVYYAHLACLVMMTGFVGLQFFPSKPVTSAA